MKKNTITIIVLTMCLISAISKAQSPFKVNLGSDSHLCIGNYKEIKADVQGGEPPYTYKWTPEEEISSTDTEDVVATPTYTTTYHVEVTDSKGKKAYDAVEIEVFFRPQLIMPQSIVIAPGESVALSAQLNGANGTATSTWKPTTGLDNPNTPTPMASPTATTTYTLKVKDSKGCIATEKITVEIKEGGEFASGKK